MRERSSPALDDPLARSLIDAFLEERLGHVPSPWPSSLEREVRALVVERDVSMLELARAVRAPDIARRVLDASTIGYTELFRHPEHFARLRTFLMEREGLVRVHSAGCSTGEEPYSIAWTALELGRRVQIVASDVNAASIARAKEGEYPRGPRGAPPGSWRVPAEVRALVEFRVGALADVATSGSFDLVFCRNVLIYFPPDRVQHHVTQLTRLLTRDGRLVVAPVEALVAAQDDLVHEEPLGWFRKRTTAIAAQALPKSASAMPLRIHTEPNDALDAAAHALSLGELDIAEEKLRAAIDRAPKRADAWFLLGEVLERRGEKSQARAAFLSAATHADHADDALAAAARRRAR